MLRRNFRPILGITLLTLAPLGVPACFEPKQGGNNIAEGGDEQGDDGGDEAEGGGYEDDGGGDGGDSGKPGDGDGGGDGDPPDPTGQPGNCEAQLEDCLQNNDPLVCQKLYN